MADTAAGPAAGMECSSLSKIVAVRVLRLRLRQSPMAAALAATMSCTAWLRVIEPIIETAARSWSPTNYVGPFSRLSKASAMTSATDAASVGTSSSSAEYAPLGLEAAQCRGVGLAEDQAEHVDALVVQFGPQRLGEHHVECLASRRRPPCSGHRPDPRPNRRRRSRRGRARPCAGAKWWHSCIGTTQLRCTMASAVSIGVRQERLEVGIGARAVDQEPDVEVGGRVGDRR